MSKTRPRCEECGVPAYVHISDMVDGVVVVRHLCNRCANTEPEPKGAKPAYVSRATSLIVLGVFVLGLSALADLLQFGASEGFGWQQSSAIAASAVILLLGAIAQAPSLFLIGLVTGVLAILADQLQFGSSPGFGVQQAVGCLLGIVFITIGVVVLIRASAGIDKSAPADEDPSPAS